MYKAIIYNKDLKNVWNQFILNSKNGTFLFLREYMDYHADRFKDHSILFYKKNHLISVIPGNINNECFYSHQGLTYGGFIMSESTSAIDILNLFELLNNTLKEIGIKQIIYKPIPYIYCKFPSQEDIYALYRQNAIKNSCGISSTIFQRNKLKFVESRKSGIRKSLKENLKIECDHNFEGFWQILEQNLNTKYNTKPVHSALEIKTLSQIFPNNIKLYNVYKDNLILAGSVIYICNNIIHVQYLSASYEGKQFGALDLLFDRLINEHFVNYDIFDFGISTENGGQYLNENLIFQKEGFGGRGVIYESYSYNLL